MGRSSRRVWRLPVWRRHAVPLAVWLSACALALGLAVHRSGRGDIVGISRGRVVHVAAPIAGRIAWVEALPGAEVRRGQVVAQLDDGVVAGQIAAVEAEAQRLRAEHAEVQSLLDADVANRRLEWTAENRAFVADAVALERAAHELDTVLAEDGRTLEGLRV